MSMSVNEMLFLFRAETSEAKSKIAGLRGELAGLNDSSASFIKGLAGFAVKATALVAAAALGVAGVSLDLAAKYQEATSMMQTNAGITEEEARKIAAAFLSTAGTSKFSADTIMKAYGPVAGQLGAVEGHALTASEALGFMNTAQALSVATGLALGSVTASLAKVMQAYHMPLKDVAAATDILYNTSRITASPISEIANAADKLHMRLGPLAPSLSDINSLFVDFVEHGGQAGRGLMIVNTAFNTLLGGSKGTDAELRKLNISVWDARGKFVGMSTVLGELAPKLAHMTDQQRLAAEKTLFGASASKALDATIMAGLPGWTTAATAVNKHGTVVAAAAVHSRDLGYQLDVAKASVVDFAIRIGNHLLPVAALLVAWFNEHVIPALFAFARWFSVHLPEIERDASAVFNRIGIIVGVAISTIVRIVQTIVGIVQTGIKVFENLERGVENVVRGVENVIGVVVAIIGAIATAFQVAFIPMTAIAIAFFALIAGQAVADAGLFIAQQVRKAAQWTAFYAEMWTEQVVSSARMLGAWIADTVKHGVQLVTRNAQAIAHYATLLAAQTVNSARMVALWIADSAKWVAQQAVRLATFVAANAILIGGAVAAGAVQVATWIAGTAAWIAQQAIRLAAFLATNALIIAGAIATGIAVVISMGPIVLVIAAIIAIGVLLITHWNQVKAVAMAVFSAIYNWIHTWVIAPIQTVIGWIAGALTTAFNVYKTVVLDVLSAVFGFFGTYIIAPIQTVIGWINGAFTTAFNAVKGVANTVFGAIGGFIAKVVGPIKAVVDAIGAISSFVGGHADVHGVTMSPSEANAWRSANPGKPLPPNVTVAGHERGGRMRFGETAWVGEGGRELATLTQAGLVITSHGDSMAAVGGGGHHIETHLSVSALPEHIVAQVAQAVMNNNHKIIGALRRGQARPAA